MDWQIPSMLRRLKGKQTPYIQDFNTGTGSEEKMLHLHNYYRLLGIIIISYAKYTEGEQIKLTTERTDRCTTDIEISMAITQGRTHFARLNQLIQCHVAINYGMSIYSLATVCIIIVLH